jgi:hypothetical protein
VSIDRQDRLPKQSRGIDREGSDPDEEGSQDHVLERLQVRRVQELARREKSEGRSNPVIAYVSPESYCTTLLIIVVIFALVAAWRG